MVLLTDGFTADGEECLRQAQQATVAGLAISTVGVGVELNEELLINIADLSKGNAHFIHDPQDIPAVFAQELSGVQANSAAQPGTQTAPHWRCRVAQRPIRLSRPLLT